MKLLEVFTYWKPRRSHANALIDAAAEVRYPALKGNDRNILLDATNCLDEQLHAVINKNADGVNLVAVNIRHHSDMLMSLGVSDALVSRAGSMAQAAIELANAGRGYDLSNTRHNKTVQERAESVAKAQAIVTIAERLLNKATKANKKNIDRAIEEKTRAIKSLQSYGIVDTPLALNKA